MNLRRPRGTIEEHSTTTTTSAATCPSVGRRSGRWWGRMRSVHRTPFAASSSTSGAVGMNRLSVGRSGRSFGSTGSTYATRAAGARSRRRMRTSILMSAGMMRVHSRRKRTVTVRGRKGTVHIRRRWRRIVAILLLRVSSTVRMWCLRMWSHPPRAAAVVMVVPRMRRSWRKGLQSLCPPRRRGPLPRRGSMRRTMVMRRRPTTVRMRMRIRHHRFHIAPARRGALSPPYGGLQDLPHLPLGLHDDTRGGVRMMRIRRMTVVKVMTVTMMIGTAATPRGGSS